MFSTTLEIVVTFWQFFAALVTFPKFEIPVEWENPLYFASVLNFNIIILRDVFPSLSDIRVYYMFVAIGIPALLCFGGIIFFSPLRVIVWYTFTLTGLLLCLLSVFTVTIGVLLRSPAVPPQLALIFAIVGVLILLFSLITFCIRKPLLDCGTVDTSECKTEDDFMYAETDPFPVVSFIIRVIALLALIFSGILLLGVFRSDETSTVTSQVADFAFALAITVFVLAGILLIWTCVGLVSVGRRGQWIAMQFLDKHFTRLFLVAVSLIFIPVGSAVFLMFNCNTFECPGGTRHAEAGTIFPYQYSSNRSDYCLPCTVDYCPVGTKFGFPYAFINDIAPCGGTSKYLLEADRSITCEGSFVFFWASAGLITIAFMIGVPLLFMHLITLTVGLIDVNFPVRLPSDDDKDIWNAKVASSENVARFLYQPFIPSHKYTRLIQLVQKLFIVFTSVFIIRISGVEVQPTWYAVVFALIAHLAGFFFLMSRSPFLFKFENRVALLMETLLVLTGVVVILILLKMDIPRWVLILLIVLNGVLPLIALAIAIGLEWTQRKSREEEEKELQELALQEKEAEEHRQVEEEEEQERKASEEAERIRLAEQQRRLDMAESQRRAEDEAASQRMIERVAHEQEEETQRLAIEQEQEAERTGVENEHRAALSAVVETPSDPDQSSTTPQTEESHDAPKNEENGLLQIVNPLSIFGLNSSANVVEPAEEQDCSSRLSVDDEEYEEEEEEDEAPSMAASSSIEETPEQRERRRKRREQAKKKAEAKLAKENEMLLDEQWKVDQDINEKVRSRLNTGLMIGGIAVIIAFGCALFGLLLSAEETDGNKKTWYNLGPRTNTSEFVGYNNWQNMTAHCCCVHGTAANGSDPNVLFVTVELWICLGGTTREFPRVMRTQKGGPIISGLGIRSVCSPNFDSSCALSNNVGLGLQVQCSGVSGANGVPFPAQANRQLVW